MAEIDTAAIMGAIEFLSERMERRFAEQRRETTEQIAGLRQEMSEQNAGLRETIASVKGALAQMDKRITEQGQLLGQRIDDLRVHLPTMVGYTPSRREHG